MLAFLKNKVMNLTVNACYNPKIARVIKKVMIKLINRVGKEKLLTDTFHFWQSLGIHVMPNHFYSPIPDTQELQDRLWLDNTKMIGLDINEKYQLELLKTFTLDYKHEYDLWPVESTDVQWQFYRKNLAFGPVDAELLYCITRNFKPRRFLEVGSGNTTYLAAQAILLNQARDPGVIVELIACEPYPNEVLQKGFPGLTKLITSKVQDVPLEIFEMLDEGDILFIDSSHVLKIGSDVQYEILEVLPRLKKGVIIHFHDIFLPAEYPKQWIKDNHWFWNEQYILQAFLAYNDSFKVIWAGSYMHMNHPDKLEAAFPHYNKKSNWPGSFWIQKVR